MTKHILEGVKIADFTWVATGPRSVSYLAQHGAEVVHVESNTRPDTLRVTAPYRDNVLNINKAAYFADMNANKYGLSLNLNHPRATEITRRLVEWADVVAESFTPGTVSRWGLSYEDLVKIKPDIIMFSTSQQGQTGPHARQPAFGAQLVALSGFTYINGWPDRGPVGPYGPYTDTIAPYFASLAIVAALNRRRKTGRGQHIDVAQYETALQFISPLLMDYTVNGRLPRRMGNRCSSAAPHNAYPCRGEDRWCFIAVSSDEEWQSLCRVMGNPGWAADDKFSTFLGRKQDEDKLDREIAAWTSNFEAQDLMEKLQSASVPAGVVQTAEDIFNDPQLRHRRYFWELEHPDIGLHSYDTAPFKLSKTPRELKMPAPIMGQHTEYVCTRLLGLPDKDFIQLLTEGVFE